MYEIQTGKYVKPKKILVDDMEWTMFAPGAGDELAMGQANRRIQLLDKKIKDGTAEEKDYDKYDELENRIYDIFLKVFKDSTDDNSEVAAWIKETPMTVLYAVMEDIKKQTEAKEDNESATEESS